MPYRLLDMNTPLYRKRLARVINSLSLSGISAYVSIPNQQDNLRIGKAKCWKRYSDTLAVKGIGDTVWHTLTYEQYTNMIDGYGRTVVASTVTTWYPN